MNNKILIITPPDTIFNQNQNILLIHPSTRIKEQMQQILSKSTGGQNVYIYDPKEDEHDCSWLLTVSKFSDLVIIDIDNCPMETVLLASYIISLPNTYWLTTEDKTCYTKLNPNRIYALDSIEHLVVGEKIEKTDE